MLSIYHVINFFGDRKIAPRRIAPQQILPWVRVRVWFRVRVGGNLSGGNFPSTITDIATLPEISENNPFLKLADDMNK